MIALQAQRVPTVNIFVDFSSLHRFGDECAPRVEEVWQAIDPILKDEEFVVRILLFHFSNRFIAVDFPDNTVIERFGLVQFFLPPRPA